MTTLGALWSQQLAFTITTTTGTIYTHALGYTPTVIILTPFGTAGATSGIIYYTLLDTQVMTIVTTGSASNKVDVTVGSFHSLVK